MTSKTHCARHNISYVTATGCPHCAEEKTVLDRSERLDNARRTFAPVVCEVHGVRGCGTCSVVNRRDPVALSETMPSPSNPNPMFTGYRALNYIEVGKIDRIKAAAQEIHNLCKDMGVVTMAMEGSDKCEADPRWIAIAETHLQQGFMALTRAIAKPTTF